MTTVYNVLLPRASSPGRDVLIQAQSAVRSARILNFERGAYAEY